MIAHLEAETAHAKACLADTDGLQEALYKEMRGRIQVMTRLGTSGSDCDRVSAGRPRWLIT